MTSAPGRLALSAALLLGAVGAAGAVAPAASAAPTAQDRVVSRNPADSTPHALNGAVKAIVQVGDTVLMGGTFTSVRTATDPTAISRSRLFAFDATTGAILPDFAPVIDGEVTSLAVAEDGRSVYVGGAFATVNGAKSKSLARLSLATGAAVPGFKVPFVNGKVLDLALVGPRLYLGGTFTTVNAASRPAFAAVDAATGARDEAVAVPFGGALRGGALSVAKLAVTPDRSRLVAIGNFSTAAGLRRMQVAVLDLTPTAPVVSAWNTEGYAPDCALVFDTYLRDVDISPDGRWFVIVTTGGYRGIGTLCDTAARFELDATGTDVQPTWVNFTGGDTLYSASITGSVVYIGGHQRWVNNPYAGDKAGQGAVARAGIAALDPVNGLPFTWNPGRARGVGVFDMLPTATGLWVGSDTDTLGGEYHGKIGFFPLAGGTVVPATAVPALPGTVTLAGQVAEPTSPAGDGSGVLHRVNAGGPAVPATDAGPAWSVDTGASPSPYRNSGSNEAYFGPVPVDASVPATTPAAIFDDERWDPADGSEMTWSFPVQAGTEVDLRIYFANSCSCTAQPGDRVFDVAVDGAVALDDLDVTATAGHQRGTVRTVPLTSDGSIDVEFRHVRENPLVSGFEIVRREAPVAPADPHAVVKRGYDGATVGADVAVAPDGTAWGNARGATMVGSTLITGWADGTLTTRPYYRTGKLGPATVVNLNGLTAFADELKTATGMYVADGRLYYTLAGQSRLYYRYFTLESKVVGAQRFELAAPVTGLDWAAARGMVLTTSGLLVADRTGALLRVEVGAGGVPTGTATVVDTTRDWRSRAMWYVAG